MVDFSIQFSFVVQAISLLLAQSLELFATLLLLKPTAKPQYEFTNFFKTNELSKERNWLLASSIGFGFLFALVVLTSFLVDRVLEPKVCTIDFSSFKTLLLFV